MNDRDDKWLDRMLDAALEESGNTAAVPDFSVIRSEAAKGGTVADRRKFAAPRKELIAAVVLGAAAAALPAVILGYRVAERNRAVREETRLLAEELIGGTIFEEGLLIEDPWPADIAEPGESFDT